MSNKTQAILRWLDAEKEAVWILTILQTDADLAFSIRQKQRDNEYTNYNPSK